MFKNKILLGIILSIILLVFSANIFTAYYKYTQESGTLFYVADPDKADALEDTNEVRQILDDLGNLLGHTKRDDSYPKDETTGGTLSPTVTTIDLTGGQIAFPSSQSASADPNTLDDYEEGSWTPALKFSGNSVDMTYDVQAGLYTKIGRLVILTAFIDLSAKGSSVGSASIDGLPFACKNVDGAITSISMRLTAVTFADFPQGFIYKNETSIRLEEITDAGVKTTLVNIDFANDSTIVINATYFTD